MKKLLQINSVVNTGSTGRIAEQLGQLAIENGWESYIAYGREARQSTSKLIRIGRKASVYIHALASKFFDCHGLMSRLATRAFLLRIDELKPDVVHIHNLHGYYINVPMLVRYLKKKDIPTVVTMHDFWLITGHCAYINASCDKWRTGCGNCPRLNQYPGSIHDRSACNWSLKKELFGNASNFVFVPVSHWLDRYVGESLISRSRRQVIYNGIDTNVFRPIQTHPAKNEFIILAVATRWTSANGFNDVMELARILPRDCVIKIVGVDDEQIKSLPVNVKGISKTESLDELRRLYSEADAVFNPNREVTFGLVTVEAMACGTPAIVLRDTAGEELVDCETGIVVDSVNDVPGAIERIKRFNPEKTAESCRRRVVEHFNSEVQFRKYIDLYTCLAEKSQS